MTPKDKKIISGIKVSVPCPYCDHDLEDLSFGFCPHCGEDIKNVKFRCPHSEFKFGDTAICCGLLKHADFSEILDHKKDTENEGRSGPSEAPAIKNDEVKITPEEAIGQAKDIYESLTSNMHIGGADSACQRAMAIIHIAGFLMKYKNSTERDS